MRIYILSVFYPYGLREQFLSNEIKELSKKTNLITIVPRTTKGDHKSIPENVKIDTTLSKNRIKNILSGLKALSIVTEDLKDHLFSNKLTVKSIIGAAIYLIRGLNVVGWYYRFNQAEELKNALIYCYWSNSEAYGASIIRRIVGDKFVYVVRAHRGDLYQKEISDWYLPFRTQIYKYCNRVYPISKHGLDYLLEHYPYLKNRLRLARLGVECDAQYVNKKNESRTFLSFVSCSFDSPVKRIEKIRDFIIALSIKTDKIVTWSHIGIEKEKFISKYLSVQIPKNCHINAAGLLRNKDIVGYYQKNKLDYFVNLSSSEGVPVTIMEALCCSIPIIATDVGGTGELVDETVGILVDINIEPHTLAELVLRSVSSLPEMRVASRRRWQSIASAKINYDKFFQDLETI
jgi:glycosyltransferase involved in cell wall biosynthesis